MFIDLNFGSISILMKRLFVVEGNYLSKLYHHIIQLAIQTNLYVYAFKAFSIAFTHQADTCLD